MLELGQHLISGGLSGYHLGQVRLKREKIKIKLMSRYLTYNWFDERRVIWGVVGGGGGGAFSSKSSCNVGEPLHAYSLIINTILICILKV